MQVERAGYYNWRKSRVSHRDMENEQLLVHIKKEFLDSHGTYGSPRITAQLKHAGLTCNRKRVARLMRLSDLAAARRRKFVVTTDSNHSYPVAENVLNREFNVATMNKAWCGDITYIWTDEGWLYLAVVMDLFSRRIVGWAMSKTIDRFLAISAMEMAILRRRPDLGLICHHDRGCQYASFDYRTCLEKAQIICSMSRRGNCWDNAPIESFFATLKKELVNNVKFATRSQASAQVFKWIEVWYNRKRLHSSLGYLSPEEFETQEQTTNNIIAA